MKYQAYIIIWLLPFLACANPGDRDAVRYEIDAKRIDINYNDREALPRSREFIRLDSTYYAGYMVEGLYRFNRSADYYGYRQAVMPLYKALNLFDRDYGANMQDLFTNMDFYQNNVRRLNDLFEIADALKSCYNVLECPDSSMKVLEILERYRFQKDFFNISSEKAWMVHRNRFFKKAKYSFLGNSIQENESLAFYWCYKRLGEIEETRPANDYWFGPDQSIPDRMHVFHQLALLHNYNRNYDSSEYYYRAMAAEGFVSWGNYAHLREEVGDFNSALDFFNKARDNEFGLNESYYYIPSLLIFKGLPKQAIAFCSRKVNMSNSLPGYGWYTIALGRSYLYDGQLDSAQFYLEKADRFHELHINTTLTGAQYRFTIQLLNLQLIKRRSALVKFLNTGWWYTPNDWLVLFKNWVGKLVLEYRLVNEVSEMEERQRLLYDLFCGESTVTFDELRYLFEDFSSNYFRKLFTSYADNDQRFRLQPYFMYFKALMERAAGDETASVETASQALTLLRNDPTGDRTMDEKLITARLLELQGDEEGLRQLTVVYPQLIPFSKFRPKLDVHINGTDAQREILLGFFDSAGLIGEAQSDFKVAIDIEKTDKLYHVQMSSSNMGQDGVQQFFIKDLQKARSEILLRVFGKGGAVVVETAGG
jgi:tetratricopeptide (TPR) repeat protein